MKIGNHLLKGKITELQKPMIMTERIKKEDGEMEYVIKAVIRKKIMFINRPTPVRNQNNENNLNSKYRKLN
jgi:hypothetical protein